MKKFFRFENWDWRIKILGPIFYSISISVFFAYNFFQAVSLGKALALLLIVAGYSLMLLARFQLKDKFSILPQAGKGLVTSGVYGIFRHPVYVSSSLAATGICVYLDIIFSSTYLSIIFLLSLVFYIIMQISRAKREEKKLLEKYGNEYKEYRKKTIF